MSSFVVVMLCNRVFSNSIKVSFCHTLCSVAFYDPSRLSASLVLAVFFAAMCGSFREIGCPPLVFPAPALLAGVRVVLSVLRPFKANC